jgi:CDGSH-type Zn-finger protein/uncharacterized Fe-S cluster protein YjdI
MVLNQNIIRDREELLFLLNEAAEFEHTVMCSYLYAAMTLKRGTDEGITQTELIAIEGWRKKIRKVVLEEMLHLSLVNNLLAAFGSAPHFSRSNFPIPAGRFPADLELNLAPFNESTLQHFMWIEKPLGIDIPDGTAFRHIQHYHRELRTNLFSPTPTDYPNQGYLYHAIANGIDALAQQLGENALFAGDPKSQVDSAQFPLPGIFAVTDVASAHKAIEEIVTQGEGSPNHIEESHYQLFKDVLDEYQKLKAARPEFEPARPSASNPLLVDPLNRKAGTYITHPLAMKVTDLGNCLYTLMLHTFAQVFAPNPLPQLMRTELAQAATSIMYSLTSVGDVATRLPLKKEGGPVSSGLSFELPGVIGQLVQNCAAQILAERAQELLTLAYEIEKEIALPGVIDSLETTVQKLNKLHTDFEAHFALVMASSQKIEMPVPVSPALSEITVSSEDFNIAATDAIRIHYDTKRCIHSRNCVLNAPQVFIGNVVGPWLHPERTTTDNMVHIAEDCPSGAITYNRLDGGPAELAPEVNVLRVRENGPYAVHAQMNLDGQGAMFRATLCRCGKSRNKPFCDSTHLEVGFIATGERPVIESSALENRGGELIVTPTHNGPLEFTGNLEICGGTGHTIERVQTARLCRCGGSENKPFCDNTHARIGFKSDQ